MCTSNQTYQTRVHKSSWKDVRNYTLKVGLYVIRKLCRNHLNYVEDTISKMVSYLQEFKISDSVLCCILKCFFRSILSCSLCYFLQYLVLFEILFEDTFKDSFILHNEAAFYTDFDTMPFIECKSCALTYALTDKMCMSVSCQRLCQYLA